MLRRLFGPRRDKETGEWRKILNGELNNLYSPPNIIREIKIEKNEIGGTCSTFGRKERCIQHFSEENEGKISPGRTTRRWHKRIKMDLQEME